MYVVGLTKALIPMNQNELTASAYQEVTKID
jgi:hypothetical protein